MKNFRIIQKLKKKTKREMLFVLTASCALALCMFYLDAQSGIPKNKDGQSILRRGSYGEGIREQEVIAEVQTSNGKIEESLTVPVEERAYSLSQLKEVFQDAIVTLETEILGENKSLEEVRRNLNLISRIPDSSIQVEWALSDYTVMNLQGELQQEALTGDGTILELTATLSYGEEKAIHTFSANLFPPMQNSSELLRSELERELLKSEAETKEETAVILPEEVEGKAVTWSQKKEQRGWYILGLGMLICVLLIAWEQQKERESEEEKKKQMVWDYPELINKLTLLLGAGMTVKNAWVKLITDYENRSDKKECHVIYEEMAYTYHEMLGGMPESESYERFGRRCKIQMYVKLGAMLSQNLKKGARGLTPLLKLEAVNALEERKANARKLGEEASTKLLAPMFFMLAIVLIIVIVPAFFSMQM
ncbi:MAG: secretion protein F [Hespellia sp.]|nr:secretion protein F [Hespellia sp.]